MMFCYESVELLSEVCGICGVSESPLALLHVIVHGD